MIGTIAGDDVLGKRKFTYLLVNADKPHLWNGDTLRSVDFYNEWFLRFAPGAYRSQRSEAEERVKFALERTENLTDVSAAVIQGDPSIVTTLRMTTAPPIARDMLTGLAGVPRGLTKTLEDGRLPLRMSPEALDVSLERIAATVTKLVDEGIFPWIEEQREPNETELPRAATVVADRLYGTQADPIIRNAQEQRQLTAIEGWLRARGYSRTGAGQGLEFDSMQPGTFSFRLIIPVEREGSATRTNIPVDAVVKPLGSKPEELPLLIEAKSAGDYANTNKRRKEEATKFNQLKSTYGSDIRFVLFLCGYFDAGYLGYEAAAGIDWVWEHRMDDLSKLGI